MNELVVISGKGGTGKTSIVASLAVLADNAVLADCDVDAADLHLILSPKVQRREEFRSGHEAVVRQEDCSGCGTCLEHCRYGAIIKEDTAPGDPVFRVDPIACEGCGVCVHFCPEQAIDFPETVCGEWFVSETRCGPMVHAKLGIAAENSGKLVATVRKEAKDLAARQQKGVVIVDGPPGIGCPVIASVSGASIALVVTEPTLSAEHDLERVMSLTRHFDIPTAVCVNKWDLNPEVADRIEENARNVGSQVAGRVRYDTEITSAQIQAQAIVERNGSAVADDVRSVWTNLRRIGAENGIDL